MKITSIFQQAKKYTWKKIGLSAKSNTSKNINEALKDGYSNVERIENTPFVLAINQGKVWIALGNRAVSEGFNTAEEAMTWMKTHQWFLTINTICTIQQQIEEARQMPLEDANNPQQTTLFTEKN